MDRLNRPLELGLIIKTVKELHQAGSGVGP